jgi:plastocyanin
MSSSLIFWLAFAFTSTQLVSSVSTQSSLTPSTTPSTIPSTTRSVASTPTPSSSKDPQVHIIKAGAGGFKFEPQQITNVSVGDIVSFEFYPPDHSVARAEFGSACVPYEYTGKGKTGFWSDTQNVTTLAEVCTLQNPFKPPKTNVSPDNAL